MPLVIVQLVAQTTGAAQSTQQSTLAAAGGTGPQPRPVQKNTLLARPQVTLAGGFSFAVPQQSAQVSPLLSVSSGVRSTQTDYLIAGVIQKTGAAGPTQSAQASAGARLTWPVPSGAQPRQASTLGAHPAVRHPLVALAVPLYGALLSQHNTLGARTTVVWRAHRYRSDRGLAEGAYRYQRRPGDAPSGEGDEEMGAVPVPPTPQTVYLRSQERSVPFMLDFARELGAGDGVASAQVTVYARAPEQQGTAAADVTGRLLVATSTAGTLVTASLGNANAVPDTQYSVRIVATMRSGLVLQETIGSEPHSRIVCDE